MELIEQIGDIQNQIQPSVVALGYFDGIHLGHQELIMAAKKIAVEKKIKSVVFTFQSHPLSILSPSSAPNLLTSNSKKIEIIESMGIDYMIFPKFTSDIMRTTPEDFVKDILVDKFNTRQVIVGFNHRFGYKGQGTPELLMSLGEKFGFEVTIIKPVQISGKVISSTLIRELIQSGQVEEVIKYLGHHYSIEGKVVHGKGLGKKLFVPTANINVQYNVLLPKLGVYHTMVNYDNTLHHAVTSVGFNPTFEEHPLSIETYILDFDDNLYDKTIEVFFIERIRDEMKFMSLEDLVHQIKTDIDFVRHKIKN
ncbi:bifunctional riboflavin kinase/FAD synthetase [Irregularibacter muris]|uniref:Riboflavin biosynthesis protein n=1 Tax=Irregularibacter muris TaxID=1796619 RepID=A0AAE3HD30_9FIRM|nr:bifunctional riboflavin kinase/FAD synthetase [Irregularibacter muris]MCR1898101.1 bifunctional riboflavin kinase/FAD synthetase [Irregularibacter muris]